MDYWMNGFWNITHLNTLVLRRYGTPFHPSIHPVTHRSGTLKTLALLLAMLGLQATFGETDFSYCFIPGEVSEYKVSWMGIPLAWSKNTTDIVEENGRELIRIRTISKSYKAYSKIYKVDDVKEVIINPKTALPVRIDLQMNEGNIHKDQLTLFDHLNHTALFYDRIANTTNQIEIADQTRDIVTFLYSMRKEKLEGLVANTHTLLVGGKLYDMGLEIRKEGRIRIPDYGKVDCIQIEPIADFDGLFLRKGKIFFWVSKQNCRMITCIQAKVPVGKIKVKLQAVSGTGDNFWDKIE